MGVLFVFWAATAVCIAAIVIASAWDAREGEVSAAVSTRTANVPTADPTATTEPRPSAVPASAQPLDGAFDTGQPPQHLFFHLDCADGVLVVITTDERLYAETSCPPVIDPIFVRAFQGVPVRLTIVEGELEIATTRDQRLTFPVGRAWIETR